MCLILKKNYKPEKLKKPVTVYKNYELSGGKYYSPYQAHRVDLEIGSTIVSDRPSVELDQVEKRYNCVLRGFHGYLSKKVAKSKLCSPTDVTAVFIGQPEDFVAKGKFTMIGLNSVAFTKLTLKAIIKYPNKKK